MERLKRAATFIFVAVAMLPMGSTPAFGQDGEEPTHESELNPWSLDGTVLVEGHPEQVQTKSGYSCGLIQKEVFDYNTMFNGTGVEPPDGVTEYISIFEGTWDAHVAIGMWYSATYDEPFPYSFTQFEFCTNVWENGWLPETAESLDSASPWITITIVGPTSCEAGQILMVRSIHYNYHGTWHSSPGTGWANDPNGEVPGVTGNHELACMDLVPGGPIDFANITDRVPGTQDNVNPTVTGMTGLETWLWYDFSAPQSHTLATIVSVNARGRTWVLDMTAWVDEVWWDVDCQTDCSYNGTRAAFNESGIDYVLDLPDDDWQPATVFDGGEEGEGQAAYDHLYRTKGDYIVSTSTVWQGVYVFAGITYQYDPVVVAVERPYQVVEVRSIITNP